MNVINRIVESPSTCPPPNTTDLWICDGELKVYIPRLGGWVKVTGGDSASKVVKQNYFLAGPTEGSGEAEYRAITMDDLPSEAKLSLMDLMSYGIHWKKNVADPQVTRVGNLSLHKSLPIQSEMKGCIAQLKGGKHIIKYYLDAQDWRWREAQNARSHVLKSQTLVVTEGVYTMTNNVFGTLQYEKQWVKINDVACQVTSIDTATKTATLVPESPLSATNYDVQLGAVLNGYDGEVMVEVMDFYIRSWDEGLDSEVRISTFPIDSSWQHQPKTLVAFTHDTLLRSVPENMGYLSTLETGAAISVVNTHDYCRGGGNRSGYDQYLDTEPCRSDLGKPCSGMSRSAFRTAARKSGKENLCYKEYKNILYWLYVIEYANFNSQATYIPELTSEGYHQGGLGPGVTTIGGYWPHYNGYYAITPMGYTNDLGNNTGVKDMTIFTPASSGAEPSVHITFGVPRWRGIENPFGDIWHNLDGVLINSAAFTEDSYLYNEVYATDDPDLYNDSDYSQMTLVGIEICQNGYIKEWNIGTTAELIPGLNGGSPTTYKCDYHYTSQSTGLRSLFLGGYASYGSHAGLGCFFSYNGVGDAGAFIGFRSSCKF